MNERILKAALMKELRSSLPHFVAIRHEDKLTSGIPDISVSGNKKTTWIEVKYGDPSFASKGIQELTLSRLSRAAHDAFYVVFILDKLKDKWTYIVAPQDIGKKPSDWPLFSRGFDHAFIIEYIKEKHR